MRFGNWWQLAENMEQFMQDTFFASEAAADEECNFNAIRFYSLLRDFSIHSHQHHFQPKEPPNTRWILRFRTALAIINSNFGFIGRGCKNWLSVNYWKHIFLFPTSSSFGDVRWKNKNLMAAIDVGRIAANWLEEAQKSRKTKDLTFYFFYYSSGFFTFSTTKKLRFLLFLLSSRLAYQLSLFSH